MFESWVCLFRGHEMKVTLYLVRLPDKTKYVAEVKCTRCKQTTGRIPLEHVDIEQDVLDEVKVQ